ncbi:hypothetical protein D3C77_442460 [compost metagenome]
MAGIALVERAVDQQHVLDQIAAGRRLLHAAQSLHGPAWVFIGKKARGFPSAYPLQLVGQEKGRRCRGNLGRCYLPGLDRKLFQALRRLVPQSLPDQLPIGGKAPDLVVRPCRLYIREIAFHEQPACNGGLSSTFS